MIKQVIDNQQKAQAQEVGGATVFPTERILGSMKPVKDFAAFCATHKRDIAVVEASFLLDYCESVTFTPEELKAFRIGLDCFVQFFKNCEADTESYIMQVEKANHRPVG
jgi:hypothetical protein